MINSRIKYALMTIIMLAVTYRVIPAVYKGDGGSAAYLLNTIAASLSTIFALSLSLIMVAIQLSAGKYSSRIFDFFLRFSLNIPLIISYVTAILHSTFILANIKFSPDNTQTIFMRKAISFDVVLMAYGFIILIVYIFNIIELLKPENLIVKLKTEIYEMLNQQRFREAALYLERLSDVAKKTTMEMDSVTAVGCIRAISATAIDSSFEDPDKRQWYTEHIIANLHGTVAVALNLQVHSVAEATIDELTKLADHLVKLKDYTLAEHIIETFSIIVSANLIGHQQLMMIQKIVHRMEGIALKAIPLTESDPQAQNLILKIFKTLNFLGKQTVDSETIGLTIVSKHIITKGLGNLIAVMAQKYFDKLSNDLFFEYIDLTVRVLSKGETKNIITLTKWLRHHLLEEQVSKGKQFILLKIFLVVVAVAIYLKSYEKASLIIKSLGKYYRPNTALLEDLEGKRLLIRHFFDYHYPDKYIREAFYIWEIYYQACRSSDQVNTSLSINDVYENLETWGGLFDGLHTKDIPLNEEFPKELQEHLFTGEDIVEIDE